MHFVGVLNSEYEYMCCTSQLHCGLEIFSHSSSVKAFWKTDLEMCIM